LVEHARPDNPNFQNTVTGLAERFAHSGLGAVEAHNRAYAQIYQGLQNQAASLAYVDTFMVLCAGAGIMFCLTSLLKKNEPGGGGRVAVE
jgi:DHA2 family multidrug resistance protein